MAIDIHHEGCMPIPPPQCTLLASFVQKLWKIAGRFYKRADSLPSYKTVLQSFTVFARMMPGRVKDRRETDSKCKYRNEIWTRESTLSIEPRNWMRHWVIGVIFLPNLRWNYVIVCIWGDISDPHFLQRMTVNISDPRNIRCRSATLLIVGCLFSFKKIILYITYI